MPNTSNEIYVVRVKANGVFNSFREPRSHKTQNTLPMPPRTTLLGFAAAAIGLSKDEIAKITGLKVSVVLIGLEGKARDFWHYRIVKKTKGYSIGSSLIFRDLLYGGRFLLYFHSPNHEEMKNFCDAFLQPVYALSLGMADELVRVESSEILPAQRCQSDDGVFNTIIPEDIRQGWKLDLPSVIKGIYEPPLVIHLPADDSPRFANEERRTYSFIYGLKAVPKTPKECWSDGEHKFFLF